MPQMCWKNIFNTYHNCLKLTIIIPANPPHIQWRTLVVCVTNSKNYDKMLKIIFFTIISNTTNTSWFELSWVDLLWFALLWYDLIWFEKKLAQKVISKFSILLFLTFFGQNTTRECTLNLGTLFSLSQLKRYEELPGWVVN